jgi:hypothetical protein
MTPVELRAFEWLALAVLLLAATLIARTLSPGAERAGRLIAVVILVVVLVLALAVLVIVTRTTGAVTLGDVPPAGTTSNRAAMIARTRRPAGTRSGSVPIAGVRRRAPAQRPPRLAAHPAASPA